MDFKSSGSLYPRNLAACFQNTACFSSLKRGQHYCKPESSLPSFSRALSKTLTKGNVNTYFWVSSFFAIFFSITRSTHWSLPFVFFMTSRYQIYCCVLRPHIKSFDFIYTVVQLYFVLSRMYSNQFGGLSTYNFQAYLKYPVYLLLDLLFTSKDRLRMSIFTWCFVGKDQYKLFTLSSFYPFH